MDQWSCAFSLAYAFMVCTSISVLYLDNEIICFCKRNSELGSIGEFSKNLHKGGYQRSICLSHTKSLTHFSTLHWMPALCNSVLCW